MMRSEKEPSAPVDRLLHPIQQFMHEEASGESGAKG